MIRLFTSLLFSIACFSLSAGLDPASRISLEQSKTSSRSDAELTVAFRLADGYTFEDLDHRLPQPIVCRGNIGVMLIPVSQLETLDRDEAISVLSLNRVRVRPTMDMARRDTRVDELHHGIDISDSRAYTGRGVLMGMMDQGLDPNHINFLNEDGKSRFLAVWTFSEQDGSYKEYTGDAVGSLTTDMPSAFHATYTAGIMAGSYAGKGRLASVNANGSVSVSDGAELPFQGVATEADIIGGMGILSDANIIAAIDKIVEYGKTTSRRPVINLSIGSAGGSFDDADILCSYLDEIGKQDAVVIAAAGNDGHKKMSYEIRKGDTTREALTFFSGLRTYGSEDQLPQYYVQIWSSDDRHPVVEVVIQNTQTGESAVIMNSDNLSGDSPAYVSSVADGDESGIPYSDILASNFYGTIAMAREVNSINHRSQTVLSLNMAALGSPYILAGVRIRAAGDSGVQLTTDASIELTDGGVAGAVSGNPDLSISSLVCADNIISVGAYVTRSASGQLCGGKAETFNYFYPAEAGYPAYFSSYATLPSGKTYPTVSAPGNDVISSYSRYYTSAQDQAELDRYVAYASAADGSRHYWRNECGTSAATPVVAGIVGTWMEADPSLTTRDVKEILLKTARTDQFTECTDKPERFGCGKVDAVAGLNEVLSRKSDTDGILADQEHFRLTSAGRNYQLHCFGSARTDAEIYTPEGLARARFGSEGEKLDMDLSGLRPGIYIMVCRGRGEQQTFKIALK